MAYFCVMPGADEDVNLAACCLLQREQLPFQDGPCLCYMQSMQIQYRSPAMPCENTALHVDDQGGSADTADSRMRL